MFRKLILSTILLTITFSGVVYTQTTITIYSHSTLAVVRYKDINNNYAFQYSGLYQIGRKDGSNGWNSGSQEDLYRSQHSFGLTSIPSNAIISQVRLIYFVFGSSSNKFTVVQTSGTNSWGNLWSEIGSASLIESDISYGSSSKVSNSLLSAINSARSNGIIYLGAYSQNEGTNNTQATVELRLEVTYLSQAIIIAQNNFIYGTIKVGVNQAATQRTSPYSFTVIEGSTVNLEAEEQTYDGYYRLWNDTEAPLNPSKWIKNVSSGAQTQISSSISHNFTVAASDNNSTYEAGLRKLCNLTFNSGSGTVYLNYNAYSSPKAVELVEQNTVYAFATDYISNGLEYTFLNWDNNPGSNSITASAHNTYTAVYSVRPSVANRNQQITSSIGQYITIQWNANPNSYVNEYRVYRKIGHTGTPSLIATTSSTTFTDPEYIMTGSSADTYLMYDVRPVYSVNQTESNPYFQSAAFGRIEYLKTDDKNAASLINNLPEEYSISNYPNPFNPTTTIMYQLPEKSFVTIKVFDILGKEVATLVNENKQAGYYTVNFDGNKLTSGVYIYTLSANGIVQTKKMLLTK